MICGVNELIPPDCVSVSLQTSKAELKWVVVSMGLLHAFEILLPSPILHYVVSLFTYIIIDRVFWSDIMVFYGKH